VWLEGVNTTLSPTGGGYDGLPAAVLESESQRRLSVVETWLQRGEPTRSMSILAWQYAALIVLAGCEQGAPVGEHYQRPEINSESAVIQPPRHQRRGFSVHRTLPVPTHRPALGPVQTSDPSGLDAGRRT